MAKTYSLSEEEKAVLINLKRLTQDHRLAASLVEQEFNRYLFAEVFKRLAIKPGTPDMKYNLGKGTITVGKEEKEVKKNG